MARTPFFEEINNSGGCGQHITAFQAFKSGSENISLK